ncbi:MAG: 50S ribosomal protein L17 [Bacteroidales bacterium]|nr:50S ribosomal protein L17 [Bacteroidales bacterium]
MRHKKSFNHLGRTSAHRKAMLSNMASSLIMHKRIETTTAKAKALKRFIEPMITRSKDDTTHSRRVVFSYLQDKDAVAELFREVSPKVADRPGGYTRIIRLGTRLGDNADMCLIELVDFNENLLAEKVGTRKSASRRRRGGSKKKAEGSSAVATGAAKTEVADNEVVKEAVVEEEAVAEAEVVEEEAVAEAEVVEEETVAEAEVVDDAVTEEDETAGEEEHTKDDDKKEA